MITPRVFGRGALLRRHLEATVRRPYLGRSLNSCRAQSTSTIPPSSHSPSTSSPDTPSEVKAKPQVQAQARIHTKPVPVAPETVVANAQPLPKTESHPATPPVLQAAASVGVTPLPIWQRLGPLTIAMKAYGHSSRTRPWATQVASTLVIFFLGDVGAQWMKMDGEEEAEDGTVVVTERKHDWVRTGRSMLIGGATAIPAYLWFSWLSRSFNYSSKILSIGTKVAVQQCVWAPLFNTYFFAAQALLSGDTLEQTWRRVCDTVPPSLKNSIKLWPAITAFSFAFIPFEYRSIFAGTIAVGWQTYLSYLNGRAEKMEAQRQREAKQRSLAEAAVTVVAAAATPAIMAAGGIA
ncbi:hypothetical protein F5Y16DRAFT_205603 [Xylariaceae sp. FL0255]|nr:hypothetical protein F5Y16DRAFT_205603 [Xylariaceae sp. FL0255]